MMEIRYNPILDEWVLISSDRQIRPLQPKVSKCPLCPGGVEFDRDYDLAVFDNRFPAMKVAPPEITPPENETFTNRPSYGKCEVVMYTSNHDSSISRMPIRQIEKLIYVWEDRTRDIASIKTIKYIFPFENRGKEVGATLSHPHGQIYAFPFIPKRVKAMIESQETYYREHGTFLIPEIARAELKAEKRIVFEGEHFVAVVPYFARFPYEVHIYPKRHMQTFMDMSAEEKFNLAVLLKVITSKYDNLFDEDFPYMMAIFQSPVNPKATSFTFHIEFYPPKRDRDKIKWMASVETGTWTFINPSTPSDIARKLRELPFIL